MADHPSLESTGGSGALGGWSLPRGVIVLLGLASLVVAIGGLKSFSSVVGPTFLALILTVTVQPLPNWLRGKGVPRWAAFLAAVLAVYAIIVGLIASVVFSIAQLATLAPTYADRFDEIIGNFGAQLADWGIGSEQIQSALSKLDGTKMVALVTDLLEASLAIFSNLVFVIVLLLFMALDASGFTERMGALWAQRPDIASAFTSFSFGTQKYMLVTTVFGLIVAVLDGGALWLLGVPLPLLWALLSFVTNYIPNIGFVIGLVPPALLALLDGGLESMLMVIVVYSVINVVIQSVIQPKFVGDAVGLSVTLTFLALVFWSWVLGPLGAILAIPITLMAKALLVDIDPATRWVNILVGSGPSDTADPEPPEPEPPEPEPSEEQGPPEDPPEDAASSHPADVSA